MAEALLSERMCLCTLSLTLLEKYICSFCFASGVAVENYLSVPYHHPGGVGLSSQMVTVVAEVIFILHVLPIHFVIIFVEYHIRVDESEESMILEQVWVF